MSDPALEVRPIGRMRTCFPEKFGIPRQSGLAPLARGVLEFSRDQPADLWRQALLGLDGFSHVWVTFLFHQAIPEGWKSRVRPPRLGGRQKQGVFATRSPHRPNFLGQSLLKLETVSLEPPLVRFSGVDLLDGTPILDLRPFHPDHDLPRGERRDGWISATPEPSLTVSWRRPASEALRKISIPEGMPSYSLEETTELVASLVALDPRPGHLRSRAGGWDMKLLGFDVHFQVADGHAEICAIRSLDSWIRIDPHGSPSDFS
ncbi:MAG: tRNA (N6-threonylcarbamoyladenosine(37)-N6)-methyltransferase TrmO [Fibrobacteria bacterium]|nr:tRNA (N6-threonylcarbamoyladenosine(37)-N6)-methyltransferase TrmO [Fibrobacteria bacterium]